MRTLIDLLTDARAMVLKETDEEPSVSRLEYRDVTHPVVSLKLLGYGLEQGTPKQVLDGLRRQCKARGTAAVPVERTAEHATA